MDRSKHKDGFARDGSSSVAAPDRDLFATSSKAAGPDGEEYYFNKYAEASQAREIGRNPRPIDDPHLSRANPTVSISKENLAWTGRPAVPEKPGRQTENEAKQIRKSAQASNDEEGQARSGDLPRLMRVGEVAGYLSLADRRYGVC